MIDPIVFGPGVSESGIDGGDFPTIQDRSTWYDGIGAPANPTLESGTVPATIRTLPEEGGAGTVGAVETGFQARITFEGVWDAVLIDSFVDVSLPVPPCSLVLQVYEADDETVSWEVGTSPSHANPYLCLLDNYGAQELDIVAGASTIGQVEVTVIDKAQIAGDQDSGWMTERLTEGAVGAIHNRRCKLIRYISPELGYVVLADGPAGTPRMDDTYAAYKWVIRDVRDTERKIGAFGYSSNWSAFPSGLITDGASPGWGELPDGSYLVPALTDYVTANVSYTGDHVPYEGAELYDIDFNTLDPNDIALTQAMSDAQAFTLLYSETISSGIVKVRIGNFPDIILRWRYLGEGDGDWREISAPKWLDVKFIFEPYVTPALMYTTDEDAVIGDSIIKVKYAGPLDTAPTNGSTVEIALLYQGDLSTAYPLLIDGITAGELLKNLYDGRYSDRDPVTGQYISTGIRYDEAALLAMTDPVRLRITEPVDDLRDWTEKKVFAPTGWVPALNENLEIAPASQIPPQSFDNLAALTDDNTEPQPAWNAGETIINFLELTYKRVYSDPDNSDSIDGLVERDITIQYRSESSITKKEEKVSYEGDVFVALGDSNGGAVETEEAAVLAADRKLYVFDRYNYGAQTIEIPVRRSASVSAIHPGDWIVVNLSWLPDYLLQRRGATWGGQIVAIHDIDCVWRVFLIEEAVPLVIS